MISVARRYHRSVSLVLDWGRPDALTGYLVSPLVQNCADRILSELGRVGGCRAWSIVGPYGTGKSAFILFLAAVLAAKTSGRRRIAADLQKVTVDRLSQDVGGPWLPVLIVGERASVPLATARAMLAAVKSARRKGAPPAVQVALEGICAAARSGAGERHQRRARERARARDWQPRGP